MDIEVAGPKASNVFLKHSNLLCTKVNNAHAKFIFVNLLRELIQALLT